MTKKSHKKKPEFSEILGTKVIQFLKLFILKTKANFKKEPHFENEAYF